MISHPMFVWAILIIAVVLVLMGVILLFKIMDMCDDVKTIRNLMVRRAKNEADVAKLRPQ
jgi:hypothetical protein